MGKNFKTTNISPSTLKKSGIICSIIVVLIILIANSTYEVKEQEQAVLLTLGKASTVSDSGLHFKIPFIQSVKKVDTTIQGISIGYDINTGETIEEESLMITSDYNFVNVDFFIEYKVSDPIKAVYASRNPVDILKNISQSCIRTVIGSYNVDSVLTTGKYEIQSKIKEMIDTRLEKDDIGISLINITIQDAEPPTEEVMEAFKAVETAKQGKETALNNANKYRNEKIPAAEAEVDKILQKAEADKQERINEATGQVARFNKMYEEYKKFPEVTKERMFYETMEEVLPNLKIIINSGNTTVQELLPIDSFTTNNTTTTTQEGEN
ncbi:MAG: FtsH protease activity modulator HflK [Lachnospiraceae bacterium]|nr:FtsH protease activity modulator HflK [Lachnospiraceae bacterium]